MPDLEKRCTGCGLVKKLDEFSKDARGPNGRGSRCKKCKSEAQKVYYRNNVDRQRKWSGDWKKAHPEAEQARKKRHRDRMRDEVLSHYGHVCACCGLAENLSVDHVFGDGIKHRTGPHRAISGGLWGWLIRNNFPAGFQILCRECNASKQTGPCCWLLHEDRLVVIERRRRAFELRAAGVSIEDRARDMQISLAVAVMDDIWIAGRAGMVVLRKILLSDTLTDVNLKG